jgi:polar amino acid transport system ATP-binding protein
MALLEIKNFKKSFDNIEVLKGIDLEVEKGQVVSIIGSSGSGKTTLLRCINFLETPNSGEMILDGESLINETSKDDSDAVLREKRLNFGLVFQSFNLFPQYSVLRNITLAPELLLNDKIKALKEKLKQDKLSRKEISGQVSEFKKAEIEKIENKALDLLKTVGLLDKINAYPCELSGGQCQRVAIARALALNPKILCFDEPTSALDPELTGEVLKVIRSLKDKDRTMIIVTHEMGFAKKVSDKIVFMANGLIEEQGTPKEIFENPKSDLLKAFLSNVDKKDGE